MNVSVPFGPQPLNPQRRNYERKPTGPRRVRDAVKVRKLKNSDPTAELGRRWLDLVERACVPDEWIEGLEYAHVGQVASMEWTNDGLVSRVQGRRGQPYEVQLTFAPFAMSTWDDLVSRMAAEAIFTVRLLADEAPSDVHELFESAGVQLVPDDIEALRTTCNCARPKPCRHIAAAAFLAADRFETEPLRVLGLRGLLAEQVLDRLRHARELHTRGIAAAHADPLIPESRIAPVQLEDCLDDFWRPGPRFSDAEHVSPPHHVAHALLRRLGPSPLEGKFPLVGLLASIYDSVTAYAERVRERADVEEEATIASIGAGDDNGESDD